MYNLYATEMGVLLLTWKNIKFQNGNGLICHRFRTQFFQLSGGTLTHMEMIICMAKRSAQLLPIRRPTTC